MDEKQAFAERLNAVIREYPTKKAFAESLGVTEVSVQNWSKNRRNLPRAAELVVIAKQCRVSVDWLLGLSDDPGRELHGFRKAKKTGWVCMDCGRRFDEPHVITESHGLDGPWHETFPLCPFCGGDVREEKNGD